MTAKKSTKKPSARKQPTTIPRRFKQRADEIARLYFDPQTPDFIRDVIGSWLTQLENELQIFWNHPDVMRAALPLMLQKAEAVGLDAESAGSSITLDALHETVGVEETRRAISGPRSERDTLREELEADAAALARLLNSPYFPADIKHQLGSAVLELTDGFNEHAEVIKTQWPLAMRNRIAEKSGE